MSAAIEAYRSSLNSPKIKGYIQHFEKDISLQISIYSDLQFQCLYRTIYGHRVLHVDATGNLVKVPHHQYKRVLNYSFIVKNYSLSAAEESSFLLGEFISSNQEVFPLTVFINRMKYQFEKVYTPFNFRLVVSDFSWTILHSTIESLNQMSIIKYANIVMQFANGLLNMEHISTISWIASCMANNRLKASNTFTHAIALVFWLIVRI